VRVVGQPSKKDGRADRGVGEQHVNGGHQAHHPTTAHARFKPSGVKTDHVGEVPKLSVGTEAFSVPGLMAGLSAFDWHSGVIVNDKNGGQCYFGSHVIEFAFH
jgi:hypothetical protein